MMNRALFQQSEAAYQDPEAIEQLSSMRVDATAVLERAKLVQLVHHLNGHAVVLLQVRQVLNLVAPQVCDHVLVVQQRRNLARVLFQLVPSLQHLVALLLVLVGHLVEVVDLLVQLAHEVGHVGRLEQLEEELLLVERLFAILVAGKVEQRVDEVAVEVGHELREQVVLLGDVDSPGFARGVGHAGWLCAVAGVSRGGADGVEGRDGAEVDFCVGGVLAT